MKEVLGSMLGGKPGRGAKGVVSRLDFVGFVESRKSAGSLGITKGGTRPPLGGGIKGKGRSRSGRVDSREVGGKRVRGGRVEAGIEPLRFLIVLPRSNVSTHSLSPCKYSLTLSRPPSELILGWMLRRSIESTPRSLSFARKRWDSTQMRSSCEQLITKAALT